MSQEKCSFNILTDTKFSYRSCQKGITPDSKVKVGIVPSAGCDFLNTRACREIGFSRIPAWPGDDSQAARDAGYTNADILLIAEGLVGLVKDTKTHLFIPSDDTISRQPYWNYISGIIDEINTKGGNFYGVILNEPITWGDTKVIWDQYKNEFWSLFHDELMLPIIKKQMPRQKVYYWYYYTLDSNKVVFTPPSRPVIGQGAGSSGASGGMVGSTAGPIGALGGKEKPPVAKIDHWRDLLCYSDGYNVMDYGSADMDQWSYLFNTYGDIRACDITISISRAFGSTEIDYLDTILPFAKRLLETQESATLWVYCMDLCAELVNQIAIYVDITSNDPAWKESSWNTNHLADCLLCYNQEYMHELFYNTTKKTKLEYRPEYYSAIVGDMPNGMLPEIHALIGDVNTFRANVISFLLSCYNWNQYPHTGSVCGCPNSIALNMLCSLYCRRMKMFLTSAINAGLLHKECNRYYQYGYTTWDCLDKSNDCAKCNPANPSLYDISFAWSPPTPSPDTANLDDIIEFKCPFFVK